MSDAPPEALFTRVTAMVAEFIDWIGGRAILTMPRYFYRKANRHLRLIKDMVREALYIMTLDLTVEPQSPNPVAPERATLVPAPSFPRKAAARIGLFNIRPAPDPVPPPPPCGRRALTLGPRLQKPDRTTEAFLRRIARIEAALADPLSHARRMALLLTKPEASPKLPARPRGQPRPPSIHIAVAPRSILSLQPRWPPG